MVNRKTLLFISPRFLFPVDSGGKIRTTQTLRGLKDGEFKIRLLSPSTPQWTEKYAAELETVCDEFIWWDRPAVSALHNITRLRHLAGKVPVPVATDYTVAGAKLVQSELRRDVSVAVFDFVHAAVLAPASIKQPSVIFTHNVEAEIFERHGQTASNPFVKMLWRNQHAKMRTFEAQSLRRFDVIVAVSDRDSKKFVTDYGCEPACVIPTGVDLEFFGFHAPQRDRELVFCGSMDWLANRDGIQFFMDQVWPDIAGEIPDAHLTVVGRAPPQSLVDAARQRNLNWKFTGWVDDVRPYVRGAAVAVIPLRVAGGTRLKVFESMAMGPAVVSTSIGVEGLPVTSGTHCLIADEAGAFAAATVTLLRDSKQRLQISRQARAYVDANFGFAVAARVFERACVLAVEKNRGRDADESRSDP